MKANIEELRALAKLEHDPDWEVVQKWLSRELAEQDAKNRATDAPEVYRGAGRSQVLAEFLEHAETAQVRLQAIGQRTTKNQAGHPI